MAVVKLSTTDATLAIKEANTEKKLIKPKKQILSEEEYTEKLEKIITRDFFPDLPKLKAQNEYLSAVEKGDIAKIQEMQLAYQPSLSTRSRTAPFCDTTASSSFETPDIAPCETPSRSEIDESDTASVLSYSGQKKESLDEFLSKTTSEDNASFQTIMEKSDAVHQQKYPWLYKDENAEQKKVSDMLALPSSDDPVFKKPELITWPYKNRNALMYVPDGVKFTPEEKLIYENRKKISYDNTRFEAPPFDEDENKEAIAEAAAIQAKMKEGKVGIDGKEIIPGESPQVNNYGFVATPIPEPGVTDTPIMTWGEIEGTPFRLDGSDTPLPQNPSGQQFKIPNLSARERIALSLADTVAKKHRKSSKKIQELKSPLRLGLGSMTPLEKLQNMSPAARKLACAKLGIQRDTDKALRASYSPSPLRTPNALLTPKSCQTPSTPSTPVVHKTTVITSDDAETMLSLPKRHKASDFF